MKTPVKLDYFGTNYPARLSDATNPYATDGKCHNCEPGTFGHECGKPAIWLAMTHNGFVTGFCEGCKANGSDAKSKVRWERIVPLAITVAVVVEGGVISAIVSDKPGLLRQVRFIAIDYDIEGADSRDLRVVQQDNLTTARAYVRDVELDAATINIAGIRELTAEEIENDDA